jgi:thiamine kinase-like enzyme
MSEIMYKIIMENLGWESSDISIKYQKEGLTNQNYIISKDNAKYVVRISGVYSNELGIRRNAEYAAMKAVEKIGIGPELIYFSTYNGNMITKYIDGRKCTKDDMTLSKNIPRFAGAMKKVHSLDSIPYNFSPYEDIESRIKYAVKNNLELPDSLNSLIEKLNIIKREREKIDNDYIVLCHNDPFSVNFLDDGNLRLLDWEYAGMGDVFFDLAAVCMFYSLEQKEEFLKYYFGSLDTQMMKSLKQMTCVVVFWNAMWAVIQTGIKGHSHDFKTMSKGMFAKLERVFQQALG